MAKPKMPATPAAPQQKSSTNIMLWCVIVIGVALRLFHFFYNRSLWMDEAFLSISLIKMNFLELASPPLEYEQKAPLGYLWAVKLLLLQFGNGEMALRLFSLLSGIASLFLFLPVARKYLNNLGAAVALAILALAPPLVFHAVEAKQYSTELFATILALYLYMRYSNRPELQPLLRFGLWGSLLLWFSYSSIFVLAGIAGSMCLKFLQQKAWKTMLLHFIPFSMWLASFAINYFLFTYKHTESDWLIRWFEVRSGFMPLLPTSLSDLKWYLQAAYKLLDYPLGLLWNFNLTTSSLLLVLLKMPLLFFLAMAAGFLSFYKSNKQHLMILVLPLLLTLLASSLKLYPFYERLTVFLAPLLILLLARGVQTGSSLIPSGYRKWRYSLIALVLAWPVQSSVSQVLNPALFGGEKKHSFEREALMYINDHFQEGDVAYIYWNIGHTYRYYRDVKGLDYKVIEGKDLHLASDNIDEYFSKLTPDLHTIGEHKRVWLIKHRRNKVNIGAYDGQPEWYHKEEAGASIQKVLSAIGNKIDAFERPDVRVTLYELSNAE
ncbi:ArnT family glycosyltransferase [Pontibacter beigongshangensis]|uniref:ArnT family glycosyltransferase n=1 Tax=Pontibacter beigongshangensis TaxID=2574733 RepID=UPI00164F0AFD|nr:glycosyltransferase family 39 protein [Pontibacter beigongshangensis]